MRGLVETRVVGSLARAWRFDPAPLCRHRVERRTPKTCACGRKEEAIEAAARVS